MDLGRFGPQKVGSVMPSPRGAGKAVLAIAVLLVALPASAQSLALRFGWVEPRLESELWSETRDTFTLEPGDFDGFVYGAEVGLRLSDHFDLRFGVETSSRAAATHYRDFVRDDGSEVVQELRLRITPVTAGVRAHPLGSDRRIVPYVTGGVGAYLYEYREEGEFIDLASFYIFVDSFRDRNVGLGGYIGAGVELGMTESAYLLVEYRRHWASGTHQEDFGGFGGDLFAAAVGMQTPGFKKCMAQGV